MFVGSCCGRICSVVVRVCCLTGFEFVGAACACWLLAVHFFIKAVC